MRPLILDPRAALLGLIGLALFGLSARGADARLPATADPGGGAGAVAFQRGTLDVQIDSPTSLAFGPDGRLYIASETEIIAATLDPQSHDVLAVEQVASALDGVLGIAFDATAPASPVRVYASRQEPSATPGYQGAVSAFTAPSWQRTDVITGLPTSAPYLNHMTNGLAFDGAGRLFIAQGSSTDAGLADPPGAQPYWPETPLSAAILVADIHAPDFDGAITYDPPGEPSDDTVNVESGDVAVYASGVRNAFDLVLHSNGRIYATDNGPIGPAFSTSCSTSGTGISPADELNLIEEGNYYGHANRNRGRFDPAECAFRPAEEPSGDGYTAPIAVLPDHCSCDGIAEYTGTAFGGAMLGDLIYVGFIRERLYRATLSEDGRTVLSPPSTLATDFDDPLDVTVGPDGTIYVAEYGSGIVSYLTPSGEATPTATATPTPVTTDTASPTSTSTPLVTATPTPVSKVGDVNCSGAVNSIDAALVLQFSAALIDGLACAANADVNGDGRVDAIDAALILQLEAGLIDSLPT